MATARSHQTDSHGAGKPSAAHDVVVGQLTHVLEEAGIFVAAEVRGDTLTLSGEVDSEENHQAALDIASALAAPQGLTIDDAIGVIDILPDDAFVGKERAGNLGGGDFAYADPAGTADARFDPGLGLDPDFTGDAGTTDSEESATEAIPYFPPTDPVTRPTTGDQELTIVGGFDATSMDDLEDAAGFDERNDDDIARAVHRELREDAQTSELLVRPSVTAGVVTLRGEVMGLEDAENADAVAARVGGVREVREELIVTALNS